MSLKCIYPYTHIFLGKYPKLKFIFQASLSSKMVPFLKLLKCIFLNLKSRPLIGPSFKIHISLEIRVYGFQYLYRCPAVNESKS